MPADVDETLHPEDTPDGYVRRLAQSKAEAVLPRAQGRAILGADTIVLIDDRVLGKPMDDADARGMLRLLSGRPHVVMTAVCLVHPPGPVEAGPSAYAVESRHIQTCVARTTVEFAPLGDDEIDVYVASGEPMGKAGAYAIQGRASRFVTRIDGSYANVVGLPVALVYNLCKTAGLLIS